MQGDPQGGIKFICRYVCGVIFNLFKGLVQGRSFRLSEQALTSFLTRLAKKQAVFGFFDKLCNIQFAVLFPRFFHLRLRSAASFNLGSNCDFYIFFPSI